MGNSRERLSGERSAVRGNRYRTGAGTSRRKTHRNTMWIVIPWILVLVNVIMLLHMRSQIRDLNAQINRLQSRLVSITEDQALIDEGDPISPVMSSNIMGSASGTDYADLWGLDKVDKPMERTLREMVKRLQELGEDSELIAQVAADYRNYPEQLLEALANNPEMADFAAHYLENKGKVIGGGLTENEKEQEYPLFLQWDPRWGYASYGDNSVVGLSGCGPTALSMVLYYLTGNEALTPDMIAEYSMREGYYISGTGTAWLLLEDVPPVYGVSVDQPEKNELVMKQALDRGEIIICSMSPGDFTIGGHFVVVYGYTEEGFLLNDPNCVARSRQVWSYSEIGGQIKHIWIFRKGGKTGQDVIPYYGY